MKDAEVRARVERLESLLEAVESHPPTVEAVAALVALYGEALARLLGGADPAEDELVSHLLLIHGLHPNDAVERIAAAIDGVAPRLRSHGGEVEFVGLEDGVARLRLAGLSGCGSTRATLRGELERSVLDAAPDLLGVEVEVEEAGPALVQIELPAARNGSG